MNLVYLAAIEGEWQGISISTADTDSVSLTASTISSRLSGVLRTTKRWDNFGTVPSATHKKQKRGA